jgi:hypothetical protein
MLDTVGLLLPWKALSDTFSEVKTRRSKVNLATRVSLVFTFVRARSCAALGIFSCPFCCAIGVSGGGILAIYVL